MSRQLLADLSGRSNPITVEKTTQVLIGEPADYPHGLVEAVRTLLKTMREVKKAWLLFMQKDGEQSFLIVVDFQGDHRKIFDAIGQAATSHLKPGQFIDMVPFGDGFGRNAVKNHKPFYKKGLFM